MEEVSVSRLDCCGILEMSGLMEANSAKEAIMDVCLDADPPRDGKIIWAAFVLFSGLTREKYGTKLKQYIEKNRLGQVLVTKSKVNPNTKNPLKAWIWAINHKNLTKWWKKHKDEAERLVENERKNNYTSW